ncbi:MAG: outer membrane beta-barrel protein [Alphaproteobacteria bacterium]|nr:outer membrane beta-barrel protein [Alphaproteobacteria bacterium]
MINHATVSALLKHTSPGVGVMLCASALGVAAPNPALGQEIVVNGTDNYDELFTDTIASREHAIDYDTAKRRGATTVDDQDRSFAQPDGLHVGQSFVYPSLGVTSTYDDNIFRSSNNKEGDLRTVFTPSVNVRSDMPRHLLDLSLSGRIVTFLENSDQNYNDYAASLRGALHFDHAHTISASLITTLQHEERGNLTAPLDAAEPVPVFHHRASAGITRDVGRLYGTLSGRVEQWDYQDVKAQNGSKIDQDHRDLNAFGGRLKVGYRISPGFELLASTSANRLENHGTGPLDVDGNSYDALIGVGLQTSPLLKFQLMGGVGVRDFDASNRDSQSTSVFSGNVTWLPTRRMTFRGQVARQISDTVDANSDTYIETSVGAEMDYEIYHNIIGRAGLSFSNSEFKNQIREDDTISASLGVEYLYSKNVHFTAGYQHVRRDSTDANFDSTNNRFTVGAKIQF